VDAEKRRRSIHARRSLRRWTDTDSAFRAHLYGNPEDGAGLWRVLDPIRRRLALLRRESGQMDSLDALDFDAIMTFASIAAGADGEISFADLLDLGLFPQLDRPSHATSPNGDALPEAAGEQPVDRPSRKRKGGGRKVAFSPTRVMVRVDLDTLLRGAPCSGELCEIVGFGAISVSTIEDLLANGNTFVVGVLTRAKEVVGIYHHGRHPNAHQKSALDFVYPTCAVSGCVSRAGLQSDHRKEWSKTHYTVLDLLDRLCPHHHRLKTHQGWALVEGSGKRDLVGPSDPRHPRHAAADRRWGPTDHRSQRVPRRPERPASEAPSRPASRDRPP